MPYCVECGEEVDEGYEFCPNCGHEVDRSPPEDATDSGGGTPDDGVDEVDDGTDEWGAADAGGSASDEGAGAAADDAPETWGTASNEETTTTGHATASSDAIHEPIETADPDVGGTGYGAPETDVDGPSPHRDGAFSFAAGYAVKDSYDALLIGAVIEFFGSFIPFIALMVRGFGFRLAKAAARGQTEPPEFGDYGQMFVDGFRVLAVLLVWIIGVGLVALVTTVGAGAAHEALGALVALLWFLIAWYGFPASLTAYAAHDSIGAAFSPQYAVAFATTGTYLKAWVLSWVLSLLVSVVVLVSMITIIGFFVAAPWAMYAYSSFWGYYYREAVAKEDKVPPAPADPV